MGQDLFVIEEKSARGGGFCKSVFVSFVAVATEQLDLSSCRTSSTPGAPLCPSPARRAGSPRPPPAPHPISPRFAPRSSSFPLPPEPPWPPWSRSSPPSSESARSKSKPVQSSASLPSTSSPPESSRAAVNRRCRPRFPPPPSPSPRAIPAVPVRLQPRRARERAPGELAHHPLPLGRASSSKLLRSRARCGAVESPRRIFRLIYDRIFRPNAVRDVLVLRKFSVQRGDRIFRCCNIRIIRCSPVRARFSQPKI